MIHLKIKLEFGTKHKHESVVNQEKEKEKREGKEFVLCLFVTKNEYNLYSLIVVMDACVTNVVSNITKRVLICLLLDIVNCV